MSNLPWLRVSGDRIVDDQGDTVILAGVGLGGWMNMENFITGYPGAEQDIRRLLRSAMGDEAYHGFFDTFLRDFFDDADAAHLASLGMNSVRIPVNYRHFEDDDQPFVWKESGFAQLERVISTLARHGIYSIIDLHAAPGCQNQHWHSDNPTHRAELWTQRHFQDRTVSLWEELARRYADRPEVAGYNPLNEPADPSGEVLLALYDRLERAIRAIDQRHILFLDGNRYSTDFEIFSRRTEPLPNSVYTAHDYALPGIAAGAVYPGTVRGRYYDRSVLAETFLRRTEYMRRTGTPIWIGEFGPVYPDPAEDGWRLRLLEDQLEIYREHGASWSLWTYKDIGLQGLVHAAPAGPYLERIEPVVKQKARLGADSWGGSDAGIREVLDPLEALVGNEFPGYDPYPWGTRPQIAVLVRHILLAEPLAERFAELFRGISVEDAVEAARSFRFDRCVERTGLTAVLTKHLGG